MQILVIALIILLLFGASRVGEAGKGFGGPKSSRGTDSIADKDDAPPSSHAATAKAEPAEPTETSAVETSAEAGTGATPQKPDLSAS